MSLLQLADYGSSSSDEDEAEREQEKVVLVEQPLHSQRKEDGPTRETNISFAILPTDIRNALERGGLSDSEDSEDDVFSQMRKRRKLQQEKSSHSVKERRQSSSIPTLVVTQSIPQPVHHDIPASSSFSPVHHEEETKNEHLCSVVDSLHHYELPSERTASQSRSSSSAGTLPSRDPNRDIERAIQQGQMESVVGQIQDIQGFTPGAWKPVTRHNVHGLQDDDEKNSANLWHAKTSQQSSSFRPNRLQRQRHQITQLAFDAQAREWELTDRKGHAMKTKAQTQAKYGW